MLHGSVQASLGVRRMRVWLMAWVLSCRTGRKWWKWSLSMATGKVLQFDAGRGYGFVAADDGGEDVFLHASVFNGDPTELRPGVPLEFQVMAGDRGRKAFAVRCAQDRIAPPITTA